jgi:hypothetical protein
MATNHLESMPLSDADGVDGGKLHDGAMEGVALTNEEVDDLFNDDQDTSQRPLDYETFLPGFSDDEGGETAFDRSWTSQKAGKASPKNKKSPRRSEDSDGDDEASPRTKRPRHSLFGGPDEEVLHQEQEAVEQNEDTGALQTPRPDIRRRFSSLTLDQQDAQDVHDTEDIQEAQGGDSFNIGFDLGSFQMTSMPNAPSRAPSEESIVIPPDTVVSIYVRSFCVTFIHITSPCTNCDRISIERKPSPILTPTRPGITTRLKKPSSRLHDFRKPKPPRLQRRRARASRREKKRQNSC